MLKSWSRQMPTVLVGLLLIGALFASQGAFASHEPANKTAAAGSDLDVINADGEHVILEDTIRVSSSQDAVISVTSECSILTSLITGDDESNVAGTTPPMSQDTARAFGQVEIYVTIDGKRVPVAADDAAAPDVNNDPEGTPVAANEDEQGEVVFCNRAYQRTVQDRNGGGNDEGQTENDIDIERDYIRTRTANGFNWLAQDIGFTYDESGVQNGNNIVVVQVIAEYDTTHSGTTNPATHQACATTPGQETTCAQAYVGSRTLIVEPTNVAIHEAVGVSDGAGN